MGNEEYYELYGEYVSLKELGAATLISSVAAMVFFFLAPQVASLIGVQTSGLSITLGAIGATIGFVISTFIIKVKRVVSEV
jgi:hypothetical protein